MFNLERAGLRTQREVDTESYAHTSGSEKNNMLTIDTYRHFELSGGFLVLSRFYKVWGF